MRTRETGTTGSVGPADRVIRIGDDRKGSLGESAGGGELKAIEGAHNGGDRSGNGPISEGV